MDYGWTQESCSSHSATKELRNILQMHYVILYFSLQAKRFSRTVCQLNLTNFFIGENVFKEPLCGWERLFPREAILDIQLYFIGISITYLAPIIS